MHSSQLTNGDAYEAWSAEISMVASSACLRGVLGLWRLAATALTLGARRRDGDMVLHVHAAVLQQQVRLRDECCGAGVVRGHHVRQPGGEQPAAVRQVPIDVSELEDGSKAEIKRS